jgi:hypothetical protein
VRLGSDRPQWDLGKSCETFNPLGPWLVTADEVPDPQLLGLRLAVNGRKRQDGSTRNMIFGVGYLIWYLSQGPLSARERYDMTELSGLAAVVTGGGSGIGQATARLLASRGAEVAVLDLKPGDEFASVTADVTDEASVRLAVDTAAGGIRVNCVNPGTADTPWVGRLLDQADDPAAERAALNARPPMGRLVSADEVAAGIAYLVSPLASSVSGTALAIDGGMCGLRIRPRS